MTTDSLPAGLTPRGTTSGTGHAHFGRLLVSEWTKLRTVRSTVWSLVALVLVSLALNVLISLAVTVNWDKPGSNRAEIIADPVSFAIGVGLGFGQLAVCVLGAMVATSEYSTGMIRSTLLASPHRLRMLAAKGVVFAALVVVVGEILGFALFFVGKAMLSSKLTMSLSDPGATRQVVGVGIYLATLGLFSLAIGQLLRHTAGAVTLSIGAVFVIPIIGNFLPGSLGKHINGYLPSNAGARLMEAHSTGDQVLSSWQGYGVFALWTAVLLGFAAFSLLKRDA